MTFFKKMLLYKYNIQLITEVIMFKPNIEYKIETCPSSDKQELEKLLNQMSHDGWELYSLSETEIDGEFCYNCIFHREQIDFEEDNEDISSMIGFKSKIERLMNVKSEPFELCSDIQRKIKDKRVKIAQIKTLIDGTSEDQRSQLNEEISRTLSELKKLQQELRDVISPDIMIPKIGEEKLTIALSEEILELVNPDMTANLIAQTVKARQHLTDKLGYVIPRVKFQDDDSIQANEYSINVRGIVAFRGQVFPNYIMYYKDELNMSQIPDDVIEDIDTYSGREIVWFPVEKTKDFWLKGLSAAEVVAQNLEYTCIKYIDELFDYNDVNCYIEIVGLQNSYLIENIIPDFLSVAEIKYILTSLIREQVSIKDIIFVFEKINDFADESSKNNLLDRIRIALSRQISSSIANNNGVIQAFSLSDTNLTYFEDAMINSDCDEDDENCAETIHIAIEEQKIIKLANVLRKKAAKLNCDITNLILVVPMHIRHLLFLLLSQFIPGIKVIAKEEICKDYSLEILDNV